MSLSNIADRNGRVVFFPVRHHSPAAARLVYELAEQMRPDAVLIEGPSDFNYRLDELSLPHKLPLAIYSYVCLEDGSRRGAYYPFCVYSPEWQALCAARDFGAQPRFIDLPWAELACEEPNSQRYADGHLRRGRYIEHLCQQLGVDDFDGLWDAMFEVPAGLDVPTYLQRMHSFCYHERLLEGEGQTPEHDRRREAYMARCIRQALVEFPGRVLVVTGGYHSYALFARLHGLPFVGVADPADYEPAPRGDQERGIALTPYSYERLDSLTGYEAGLPNPGFYHEVWQSRQSTGVGDYRGLLARLVHEIRERGQLCSTADVIALETMARGLATLRGHSEAWRSDLLDAVTSSLIKEELEYGCRSPFLDAVHAVFRGGERGQLAAHATRPPLVTDLQRVLDEQQLAAEPKPRDLDVDLHQAADLTRSRLLHRVRLLDIAGYTRVDGTDLLTRADLSQVWERWRLAWSPEFEATSIEAARYGTTVSEAVTARLVERARAAQRDTHKAAQLLVDAALAGLPNFGVALGPQLLQILGQDGSFVSVTAALNHVLYLYRYDEVLGTSGVEDLGTLLTETYGRAVWLLERLGQVSGQDAALVRSLRTVWETFLRCAGRLPLDRNLLVDVLTRVEADPGQLPLVRGAAAGMLWLLDEADVQRVRADLLQFADPTHLGDFLTGLFALARELVQRHFELIRQLDEVLMHFSAEEFFQALPALRLAFTFFTPREKHYLATSLLKALGIVSERPLPRLQVTAAEAAAALRWEERLYECAVKYGVRTGTSPLQAASASDSDRLKQVAVSDATGAEPSSEPAADPRVARQMTEAEATQHRVRWRLVLGAGAEEALGACLEGQGLAQDRCLDFLYGREYGAGRNVRSGGGRSGGLGASQLSVPEWINQVHTLFPQKTIERLEQDALERYELQEMVTNPEVLERAQPNLALVKAVLHTKHLMNQQVLAMARSLVRKVVQQLLEKLAREVRSVFLGAVDRRHRSLLKVAKNFDLPTTIRRNLAQYQPAQRRIFLKTPYFFSRVHRQVDRWTIIILVDESGSMADSVIHSAVTAAIFCGLKSIRTHLCLFDTEVVDVTNQCSDPVETIMKVQLGGGTDIGHAMQYAAQLVENPRRTIVVLISDFFEGGSVERLLSITKQLVESGTTVLGLAALDERANPSYDRRTAEQMVLLGAHVAAMTPGELAAWVAQKVR